MCIRDRYNDDLKDGLWYTKDLETRDIHYEEYREDKFIVRYTEYYYPNYQLMEKYAYRIACHMENGLAILKMARQNM